MRLTEKDLKDISILVKELSNYFNFFNSVGLSQAKIQLFETSFTEVENLYEHIMIPLHNYLENFDLVSDKEALSVLTEKETHLGIALSSNPIIEGLGSGFTEYVLRHKKYNNKFYILFKGSTLVFDNEETAREAGLIIHKMLLDNIIYGEEFFDKMIYLKYKEVYVEDMYV